MFDPLIAVYHGLVHMAPPVFLALAGTSAGATQLWPAEQANLSRGSVQVAVRRTAAVLGAGTLLLIVLTMLTWTANAAAHGQL